MSSGAEVCVNSVKSSLRSGTPDLGGAGAVKARHFSVPPMVASSSAAEPAMTKSLTY